MTQLNNSFFKRFCFIFCFLLSLGIISNAQTPNLLEKSFHNQSDSLFYAFLQAWTNEAEEEQQVERTEWQQQLSSLVNEVLQQELTITPRKKGQLLVLPSQIPLYLSDHTDYHLGYMLYTTPLLLSTSTLDIQFEEEIDVYWQDAYLYDEVGEFLRNADGKERQERWTFLKQYLPMDSVSFGYDDSDVGEWYRLCVQYNHLYRWMMLSKPFITAIIADKDMTNVTIFLNPPNGNRHVYRGQWHKKKWKIERHY